MDPHQGEGGTPPSTNDKQPESNEEPDRNKTQNEENSENSQQKQQEQTQQDKPKVSSFTCKPVGEYRPKVELPSHRINARIQYMRDHALIGKFIGIWPNEKDLRTWINVKWHPKGHISLHLGPKGFFTAVFNCLEDRNRVFESGPYLFNSAGLFLREWIDRFNLDKEDLSWAPVWIRLYSLPWEY